MRKKTFAILLATAALLSLSCAKEPEGSISLSLNELKMDAGGGLVSLTVTTNFAWTANCGTTDVTMSTKKGEAGTTEVQVEIPGNPEEDSREILVKFNCENAKAVLTVSQSGAVFELITITHESGNFCAPVFEGAGFTGKVSWGDGKSDSFTSLSESLEHPYDSLGVYTVQVKVHDSDAFTLPSMDGVTEVNLTEFSLGMPEAQ